MEHERAWALIQKRQEYLDNLESQAGTRRSELAKLNKAIKQKQKVVAKFQAEAEAKLLEDNSLLVSSKRHLTFDVLELEKKHKILTDRIEFAWAEHNDLMKTTSHLNQEVSMMMAEVNTETVRGRKILKDLETQIKTKMAEKASLDTMLAKQQKQLKDLQATMEREQSLQGEATKKFEARERQYEEQITQNKRQLEDTYNKLYKAIDQLKDISSKDKAMRESIADAYIKLEGARIKHKPRVRSDLLEL